MLRSAFALLFLLAAAPVAADESSAPAADKHPHPLLDAPKDRSRAERIARAPVRLIELPFAALGWGLEQSLDFMERKDLVEKVERAPRWLYRHHLIVEDGGQGAGSGLGVGVGAFALPGRGFLGVTSAWTVREYQAHKLELRHPLGARVGVRAWGQYRLRARDNFFGMGRDSAHEDESQYEQENVNAGLRLGWRPASWQIALVADWNDWRAIEPGRGEEYPSTGDVFPGLPGAGGAELLELGLTLTRPIGLYRGGRGPEAGIQTSVQTFLDTRGDEFGFTRVALTAHGALPVFRGDRVVALRVHASVIEPHADRAVPFFLLSHLGGASGLRAYESLRFRDRDVVLANAEYRFPIWDIGVKSGLAMDAVLFFDAGLVSSALEDDLGRFEDYLTDGGFGFRIRTDSATQARLNVGFGHEGTRVEYKLGRDW